MNNMNRWVLGVVVLVFTCFLSFSRMSATRAGIEPKRPNKAHRSGNWARAAIPGQDQNSPQDQQPSNQNTDQAPTEAAQPPAPAIPETIEHDSPDKPPTVTLPAGTVISVRIADAVNSNHNHTGDEFTGTVDPSVLVNNRVVIPRGTEAHMRMAEDKKGGHLHGKAEIKIELTSLVLNAEQLGVDTDTYAKKKGALTAKAKAAAKPSAGAAPEAAGATAANPAGAVVDPAIAAFRAAKVELPPGSRVPFALTNPFTFERLPVTPASSQ